MNPLVSVIVPSYQQAGFLRQAIDSILVQDYEPVEVLVLDGGSSDGSREILESYGDRIWFRSGPDAGQASAINEGFRRSQGEIVAWLNSDDFYYPGAIGKAVEALRRHPEAALAYGHGNHVDEEGRAKWLFPETASFDLWQLANVADYILQPTAFLRREDLFSAGLLDEGLHWGLDWDLWIRMGERRPFVFLDEILAASRLHPATKTATGGFRRIREVLRMLRRNGVEGLSPAVAALSMATLVRTLLPSADVMTAEVVSASVPGAAGRLPGGALGWGERTFRRWLRNAQGVWPDGLVGRRGKVWLPSDGRPCRLEIAGRNLDLPGQLITLRSSGQSCATGRLDLGETFRLELEIPAGSVPVKAEILCGKTARIEPRDTRLGPRRAGFSMISCKLVDR